MIEPRRPDRQNGVAGGGGSSPVRPTSGGRSGPTFAVDSSAPVGPEAAGDPFAWLKDGRYVKVDPKTNEVQPLLGSELQSSTTPEYKLMAFRLRLVVDEAQYPRIIEELANSVLPIEVREVRILPNGQNVGQSAPVGRSMPGRGNGGRPLAPRDSSAPTMSAPRARSVAPTPSSMPSEGGTSHNVPLEIYGVVYLMQRPKKLNLPDTSSGAAASATPWARQRQRGQRRQPRRPRLPAQRRRRPPPPRRRPLQPTRRCPPRRQLSLRLQPAARLHPQPIQPTAMAPPRPRQRLHRPVWRPSNRISGIRQNSESRDD